ncbi:MAG: GIY-YIG nuclease family protein, partial [Chitinophagaceae bacterium]
MVFFMHYVYIIKSKVDGSFYKGYSTDPVLRLHFHNEGRSPYTSNKKPWELLAVLCFSSKTDALQKDKKIKKYNLKSL